MTIMTVEMRSTRGMRGFGDVSASTQNALDAMQVNRARGSLAVRLPQALLTSDATGYVEADFVTQYGIPIGAGVAGLAVGLVIAKLARRRK